MNHPRCAAAVLACLQALGGCTAMTQDNFANPPPGAPPTCSPVAMFAGCAAGAISYSCTGQRPDDTDPNLVCDEGTAGVDGQGSAVLYCCAPYAQWASGCTPAAVARCGKASIGFSCSGRTSPDEADMSLVCSESLKADGGTREYCCVSFDQTSGVCRCSSFDEDAGSCGVAAVSGCTAAAIPFTCSPTGSPSDIDPLLDCTAADGSDGAYCCTTP